MTGWVPSTLPHPHCHGDSMTHVERRANEALMLATHNNLIAPRWNLRTAAVLYNVAKQRSQVPGQGLGTAG